MTYDQWKSTNPEDEWLDDYEIQDDYFEIFDPDQEDEGLLIGPLGHKLVRGSWVVDFSRPGALARYSAEATEWWSKNFDKIV